MKFLSITICLITVTFFVGCTTARIESPIDTKVEEEISSPTLVERVVPAEETNELENIKGEELEEVVEKKGVIFAKTDFKGVLETSYVKLIFEHQENEDYNYQIYIGDTTQAPFSWDVKTVKPGYFFVELPEGPYKISSISIPVGSTLATEEININFVVAPNEIHYLGTLNVIGTKEKIKLGGVPVIKPGFEYTATILNESEEAMTVFSERYPEINSKILIRMMTMEPAELEDAAQ